jgi:hypothetical protein
LNPLPYVQLFDSDAVKQALLGEFFVLKESHRDGKKQIELKEAAQAVVKSIDKYYRRASIKLHPNLMENCFDKNLINLPRLEMFSGRISFGIRMYQICWKLSARLIRDTYLNPIKFGWITMIPTPKIHLVPKPDR